MPVETLSGNLMGRCVTPISEDHGEKFGVPSLEELGEEANTANSRGWTTAEGHPSIQTRKTHNHKGEERRTNDPECLSVNPHPSVKPRSASCRLVRSPESLFNELAEFLLA